MERDPDAEANAPREHVRPPSSTSQHESDTPPPLPASIQALHSRPNSSASTRSDRPPVPSSIAGRNVARPGSSASSTSENPRVPSSILRLQQQRAMGGEPSARDGGEVPVPRSTRAMTGVDGRSETAASGSGVCGNAAQGQRRPHSLSGASPSASQSGANTRPSIPSGTFPPQQPDDKVSSRQPTSVRSEPPATTHSSMAKPSTAPQTQSDTPTRPSSSSSHSSKAHASNPTTLQSQSRAGATSERDPVILSKTTMLSNPARPGQATPSQETPSQATPSQATSSQATPGQASASQPRWTERSTQDHKPVTRSEEPRASSSSYRPNSARSLHRSTDQSRQDAAKGTSELTSRAGPLLSPIPESPRRPSKAEVGVPSGVSQPWPTRERMSARGDVRGSSEVEREREEGVGAAETRVEAEPEPTEVEPEPEDAEPQPEKSEPQPQVAEPQPQFSSPQPTPNPSPPPTLPILTALSPYLGPLSPLLTAFDAKTTIPILLFLTFLVLYLPHLLTTTLIDLKDWTATITVTSISWIAAAFVSAQQAIPPIGSIRPPVPHATLYKPILQLAQYHEDVFTDMMPYHEKLTVQEVTGAQVREIEKINKWFVAELEKSVEPLRMGLMRLKGEFLEESSTRLLEPDFDHGTLASWLPFLKPDPKVELKKRLMRLHGYFAAAQQARTLLRKQMKGKKLTHKLKVARGPICRAARELGRTHRSHLRNANSNSNHESELEDKAQAEAVANLFATTKALCHSMTMGVREESAMMAAMHREIDDFVTNKRAVVWALLEQLEEVEVTKETIDDMESDAVGVLKGWVRMLEEYYKKEGG